MRAYDSQEWADSWRSAFPPQQIGNQVIVAPTWHHTEFSDQDEAQSDNSKILIRLDPGMAFGTGHFTDDPNLSEISAKAWKTHPVWHFRKRVTDHPKSIAWQRVSVP